MQQEVDADTAWVERLSGQGATAVARAVKEAGELSALFRHIARAHAREGRPNYGEIDAPVELHALVRLARPRHVVEVGVSSGVSSAYLLHALELNGRGTLHSVDLPRRAPSRPRGIGGSYGSWSLPPGQSSGWAVPQRLRARWDLRTGDKARVLPLLAKELPAIDLFVYDVPHEDSAAGREFRTLDLRVPAGGAVIVDHGPGGGLCPALRSWARRRHTRATGRTGTGLFGMRVNA